MLPRPPMTPSLVPPAVWQSALEGRDGFTDDSRQVKPNYAFALCARTPDEGLAWARNAESLGASVLFHDPAESLLPEGLSIKQVAVPGLRAELSRMAAYYYGDASASMPVFGVTGTNGKTSCSHWLAQALNHQGGRCGVIGTLGAGLMGELQATGYTTPGPIEVQAWLASLKSAGAEAVAMEVSSHALAEARVDAVRFQVALFTNLTHDHLDYHGSFEAYAHAKAQLFEAVGLQFAVLNIDDPFGCELAQRLKSAACEVLTYSAQGREANYRAEALRYTDRGFVCELSAPEGRQWIEVPLTGAFNVANVLGVAASLSAMGMPFDDLPKALACLVAPAGRMETLVDARGVRVVIDYAHTPDALEKVLKSLRAGLNGRLIAVFGCGGERDATKRPVMGALAETLSDLVILTSDNPRSEDPILIMEEIASGMHRLPYGQMLDRAMAIRQAIGIAESGDVVLVAGKGHEAYQEILGVRHPFSDRTVVEACFANAGGLQ